MATEADLVESIRRHLQKNLGGLWYKIHGGLFQEKGIHDLIGCIKGQFVSLEVKLPGKEDELSLAQGYQMKRVRTNGGLAEMVTTKEEALRYVVKMLADRDLL